MKGSNNDDYDRLNIYLLEMDMCSHLLESGFLDVCLVDNLDGHFGASQDVLSKLDLGEVALADRLRKASTLVVGMIRVRTRNR
jgi:hypothetical protein